MIDYSLGLRKTNPSDKDSEKKVYPYPQVREVLTLQKLAKHIAEHGSPYTRDVVVGVVTATVDCIREQLLGGNKVQLGEMGSFYVTFSSEGIDDADKFNPQDHIKSVNVRWDRGRNFAEMKQDAEFNYVASRKQQAQAKKDEKAAPNEETKPAGGSSGDEGGDVTE